MKFSLFISTSVDGIIAKEDGNVDLLHASGEPDVSIGEYFDFISMKTNEFFKERDLIIGRI